MLILLTGLGPKHGHILVHLRAGRNLHGPASGSTGQSNAWAYRTAVHEVQLIRWGLQSSDYYMYRQFNIQQFYVLPTQCIYVFCVDLRTNSDYFPIQH